MPPSSFHAVATSTGRQTKRWRAAELPRGVQEVCGDSQRISCSTFTSHFPAGEAHPTNQGCLQQTRICDRGPKTQTPGVSRAEAAGRLASRKRENMHTQKYRLRSARVLESGQRSYARSSPAGHRRQHSFIGLDEEKKTRIDEELWGKNGPTTCRTSKLNRFRVAEVGTHAEGLLHPTDEVIGNDALSPADLPRYCFERQRPSAQFGAEVPSTNQRRRQPPS